MKKLGEVEATAMMNDPTYKRVVFLRDPASRLLSAYLDKFVREREFEGRRGKDMMDGKWFTK